MKQRVLSIIDSAKSDIKVLRTALGLHRLDTDVRRFERWEITSAKLLALTMVRDAVIDIPDETESDELLFHKLNSSMFRDWLVSDLAENEKNLAFAVDRKMVESAASIRSENRALRRVLDAFENLGNAGVQPKNKENELPPIGKPPVTAEAPTLLDLLGLIPGKIADLNPADLVRISDWCLDNLEMLGSVDRWSPDAGSVGEGDMERI